MDHKLLQYPAALCNQIRRIAIEAGEITLEHFDDAGCDFLSKSDGSPVTIADQKAEKFIEQNLQELLPEIPIVGEENIANGANIEVKNHDYFWLVDALDGTKEFISGSGEYTINIALIHQNKPTLGIVYAPWLGELYGGFGPNTAFKWNEETGTEKKISVRPMPKTGLTVVASKSHGSNEKLDTFLQQFKVKKLLKKGSSLKICAIAAGKADLYPRFGPTCEWDTAAAHAVLLSAGGFLQDAAVNEELSYGNNRENKWLNPEFIASSFSIEI